MKKMIASLFVLCMSILLCAASNDKTLCTCGCDCGPLCSCAKMNIHDENSDCFLFSSPKIVPGEKDGIYRLDFQFSCLYPKEDEKDYPSTFNINYALLDTEQVAIKICSLQIAQLSYGDKVRASACPHFKSTDSAITSDQLKEIKYVKFMGCDPRGAKSITFQFQPVFSLTGENDTDLALTESATSLPITTSKKQKTVIRENANAQLAIEDFEITEVKEDRFYFKVKLRNITDNTLELSLRYQILDSNRDILTAQLIGATTDPAAGQAIWAGPYRVDSLNVNAAYISFVSSDYEGGTLQEEVLYPLQ